MSNKNLHYTIRFLNTFNKFFELKKELDGMKILEVDTDTLYNEFEEKLINNMKLLCFKIFLKDPPGYSKWSKGLDQLKKDNQRITSKEKLLGGSWKISTKKLNSLLENLNPGSKVEPLVYEERTQKRKNSMNLSKGGLQMLPPSGKTSSGRITTGLRYHNPSKDTKTPLGFSRSNSFSSGLVFPSSTSENMGEPLEKKIITSVTKAPRKGSYLSN